MKFRGTNLLAMFPLLILLLTMPFSASAQVMGGSGSGQSVPAPATKADLDAGPVGDNVNLFTGNLSLSYSFGNVATLSGLTFPLELQYTGNVLQGLDPVQNSGIPYGEGWALTNAAITVDGYAWDFTEADPLPTDPVLGTSYSLEDVEKRGQVYFANPRLQLPGGGGGRLVYKYPDKTNPTIAVYHLDAFDTYIEVRFDGETWVARTDDGTEWVFGLAQYTERNPTNVTAHLDAAGVGPMLPHVEISRWHLTEIRNANHPNGQRIVLDYLQFGAIDMHPELNQLAVANYIATAQQNGVMHIWTQHMLDSLLALNYTPMHGPGDTIHAGDTTFIAGADPLGRTTAYRDILLSRVTALDAQGLQQSSAELIYRTWRPEVELATNPTALGRGRFLLLSDPQVVRRDSLYAQKTVWFRGTDRIESQTLHEINRPALTNPQLFEGAWQRIMHPRAYQNPLSAYPFTLDSRNPYKFRAVGVPGVINGWYMSRMGALSSPNATSGAIKFTHSVLESPRIDLAALPSGETYELRTLVQVPSPLLFMNVDMNLDFRIVSGLNQTNAAQSQSGAFCPHVQIPGTPMRWQLTSDNLQGSLGYWETGYEIKSTTRDIVKWNPAQAGQGSVMATATPFFLPNLPNEFAGFQIQVGPGSSNLKHNQTSPNNLGYPGFYTGRDVFNTPRDSFELGFGTWFGTGAPIEPFWRGDKFGITTNNLQWSKGINDRRRNFWQLNNAVSYNPTQLTDNGAAQPTAVTWEELEYPIPPNNGQNFSFNPPTIASAHEQAQDAELLNVELVRISRNPWMLDSVIIRTSDPFANGDGRGICIAAWKLNYTLAQAPIPNNLNPIAEPSVVAFANPYRMIAGDTLFRNLFQLTAVLRLDVDTLGAISAGNGLGSKTAFGYLNDNPATPTVFEGQLLSIVRDGLGGKTTYTYNLAQTVRDNLGQNPVGLRQDKSWEVIGSGRVSEIRTPIASKAVEGATGPVVTDYIFLQPVKLYRGYSIDPHFGNGWNTFPPSGRVWGYTKAVILKPALTTNGPRARSEYRYRVDSSGHANKLLLGRLHEVREFDATGALIGRKAITYAATPAYRNGSHVVPPSLDLDYGHQVMTPSNAMRSYEHSFLWNDPARGQLMESWFTRMVGERSVDIDPVTGDSIVLISSLTHFDWSLQQGDPDGDYAEMHRPAIGTDPWLETIPWAATPSPAFNYPPEPSWQVASSYSSSSAVPGAWTLTNNYYLWDIEPFLMGQGQLQERFIGSMRPFWLARRHGVRDAVVEQKVTVFDGDPRGKPVALSTWYEWDVFRDVPGDFIFNVDSTNYGIRCIPGGGGPMDPTRHAVANCVKTDTSEIVGVEKMVTEVADHPLHIQLNDSTWHRLSVWRYGAVDFDVYGTMPEYGSDTVASVPFCPAGFVTGPDGKIKWFGTLDLGNGSMAPVTDILPADRNYGEQFAIDSLTEESKEKPAVLVFTPHIHFSDSVGASATQMRCDTVHSFTCDSAMNATIASDLAVRRQGGEVDNSAQRQNFIDWLDWQFSLRAVHQQVDTVANVYSNIDSLHNPEWASPHNVWFPVNTNAVWQSTPYRFVFKPSYPTVCTYRVHERNMLGQVVDESDARHLHKVFEYAKGEYRYWFDSCGTAHSAILRPFYALPLSVTVTDFEAIELVTRFSYQPNQILSKVISPNGEQAAMVYDGRHRLTESSLNGTWRSQYEYGGWNGATNATWNQRIGMNFLQSKERIGNGGEVLGKAFSDPMGRSVQGFVAIKDMGPGWHKRFGGKTQLDNWSRVTGQGKSYHKHFQPQLNYDPVVPGSPAATARYEASAKSRVLRSAKPGNALNGNRAMVSTYKIIRYAQFVQETGITQAEGFAIWPGLRPNGGMQVSPSVIRIYRTATVDEDGREGISYTDAFGREIASLRYDQTGNNAAQARVLTLYARDAQGRVNRVIHPDKLETQSKFNLLGWPYLVTTPDGGTTRMMYNQAGDMRFAQDANLKAKRAFACAHVDRMGRVFRETEAQLDIVAIGNQTYYPLVYTDTLGIPFRSIHTICDELEHVNTVTDPNAGLQPWAWHYLERSFPKLNYPERNAKLVGETRYDFPLDSNVVSPLVATVDPAVLHPQVNAAVQGFGNRTAGRVTAQKVYGEANELLEITLLDYDNEGRLTTMLKQFDPVGITATRFGRADAVLYPAYNLNGTVKQQDTDIGCDGRADFSQLFDYDAWGRLETVRVRHGRGTDKVAKYLYNDGLGLLRGVIHYANADSTGNCPLTSLPADTILYSYDQQDRLTGFGSRFLDYGLAYDATNINYLGGANPTGAAVVNTSQNWAGGINGWKAKYKVTASGVTGFDGATVYGFQYDGLHRLVAADAAVMEQPFTGQNGWNNAGGFGTPLIATRAAWYGDEKYAYDKVGNLTGLRRYKYFAPGAPTPGLVGDNWKYQYTQGTNRLAKLQTAGMQDIRFTYDGNGNLLTDSKKGITVTQMGRNDLPTEMTFSGGGTVKYRHGAGGRVYKIVLGPNGTSVEYYLRDAGGAPLGVFSQLDSTWTFQIYGLDLIGEMALKAQGDSVARYANNEPSSVVPETGHAPPTQTTLTLPKHNGKNLIRNVILGVAVGIQQSLAIQNHSEERPKFLDQISTFLVPILATVADAVVDGLSPTPEPALLPPAEPETSQPDTTAYPTIKFFVKDHLGNVRVAYKTNINDTTCLVDRKVVAVMDYSPYGGLLRAWFDGDPEKWQSTGHERDLESGWDFRGARLYDASYGRFLSRDPLGGMYPGWSPYNYVLGNPVSLTDPSGMSAEGGGKDGNQYLIAEEGLPNVDMDEVQMHFKAKPKHWTQIVVENYQKPDYFSIDDTQRGRGSGMCTINVEEWMIQGAADGLGATEMPVVSQIADIGSAAISFKNGDNLGGALSLAASVSAIGAIFTVGKYIKNGLKIGSKAENAATTIAKSDDEIVSIYRNFGMDEYESIVASGGKFVISPKYFQGKQFWFGESGINWWKTKRNFVELVTVKVDIPKSYITPGHKNYLFLEADGMIDLYPGGTVLPHNMDKFNSVMKIDWLEY
ncbi:MAG: RHS repeat-associated core domain-containing protein [Bacteroidetes bacterium]|nr:RHS repeat-associated core domain-containing protein [Bacteroidota bacterium]